MFSSNRFQSLAGTEEHSKGMQRLASEESIGAQEWRTICVQDASRETYLFRLNIACKKSRDDLMRALAVLVDDTDLAFNLEDSVEVARILDCQIEEVGESQQSRY